MTRHQAIFNLWRPHVDTDQDGNLLSSILTTAAWPTLAVALTQAGDELLLEAATGHHIEGVVNGLMRDLAT
ncbi:hypothetical protein HHA01_24160 [Halomonas halmophila]|uniref:Uncharacterized protein n=1 Tax=Halomonas halmophila TaxID=252 RepID=A0A4Y4F030_9GAMM|nr:hypothetical protein HHA01_24160 [Halomonas halmophila]